MCIRDRYEPSRKTQDAYEVGLYRFPDMEHIPTDVALIPNEKFKEMKEMCIRDRPK